MLQAQYRDKRPALMDLKRLHKEGKLTDYQEEHWFGARPKEELYDLALDPHQMTNLAADPEFGDELKAHRQVLAQWIVNTGDKGEQLESATSLKPTYDLWKELPIFKNADVNPEYDQFR